MPKGSKKGHGNKKSSTVGKTATSATTTSHHHPTTDPPLDQLKMDSLTLEDDISLNHTTTTNTLLNDFVVSTRVGGVGGESGTSMNSLSPRLMALQQQLEQLENDRFLLQRAAEQSSANQINHLNASSVKTEVSLQNLKKRLSEVRQQLYGTAGMGPSGHSLADLAKSYFGGILKGNNAVLDGNTTALFTSGKGMFSLGGFPGEGDAFDYEDEDDEVEVDAEGLDLNNLGEVAMRRRRCGGGKRIENENNCDGVMVGGEEDSGLSAPESITDPLPLSSSGGRFDFTRHVEGDYFEDEILMEELSNNSGNERRRQRNKLGTVGNTSTTAVMNFNIYGDEEDEITLKDVLSGAATINMSAFLEDGKPTAKEELEEALDMIGSPSLPSDKKLEVLREKFANIVKHDRHWRARVQKASRVAHDERIQRQLLELELEKANTIKQRLESLCRNLHNENRRLKAEQKEKENERNNVEALDIIRNGPSAILSQTIASLTTTPPKLDFPLPTLPPHDSLIKEGVDTLVERVKSMADLYMSREEHFATVMRHRECDLMIAVEKLDLLNSQFVAQSSSLEAATRRVQSLARSEAELKHQVRQYVDKFRQVEETLGKSNDLFGTFRSEMEQMGSKLARLERENAQLNSKCATLSRNIIEMADERTKQNTAIDALKGQKAKLEQLCRTLQAERNAALKGTTAVTEEIPSTTQ